MITDTKSKLSALGVLVSALIVGEFLLNLLGSAPVAAAAPDAMNAQPVAASTTASR
jgi:hypothetical protein